MDTPVEGFSKRSKAEKIAYIAEHFTADPKASKKLLEQYWNPDPTVQKLHDEFIENTISNYYLPFAIAPNFLINGKLHVIPMAIEESSVVAAASKAAKFWLNRGGFKTKVIDTEKVGQVHFIYKGDVRKLQGFFEKLKPKLIQSVSSITQNMEKRGGGINDIQLRDLSDKMEGYHQLHCTFETLDAMGANFINSCLEQFAKTLKDEAALYANFAQEEKEIEIVMSILSNYVPNCLVRAEVSCTVSEFEKGGVSAEKFVQAVNIAKVEPYRAVTHNKGIMNGVDAVVLATGNDFRAVEAGVHAYASKDGQYSSLTHASIENDIFSFWIEIPLALGTVGGLTTLHPLVKLGLEILQNPSAKELMQIVAVAGLAQNFAALRSLVTTGIQKGHMKMHLMNMLNQMGASESEKQQLVQYFKDRTVTNASVKAALEKIKAE
ncbi:MULTISPECIES: hydroxymethylglutaryl-CoA reductase, degradative [Flavobacteriaceae]|uniref:3-hydroxy-3-methylglutaryl coenzyme A reductase n=1 Tax=Flagellimonas alvinocaridis TaxID=2530200 RepID=A0A4S8RWM3_9FLAO|nr:MULTISPECIES: hydroxymethylglutaryl-CoA reductase, degradative [Allomuricauda]MDC6364091.1 hydroxymethylglutaryl-CoA reductase, degradative [Muricauda sp. SP22]THV61685.1 hydroxymethylglutaryl-CoA reductase, degradative [Allomuricauda alvinocaridis]